jgi:hypothetical protein
MLGDIMDYYFMSGSRIINNDINRPFIMWLIFICTFSSALYFIYEKDKLDAERYKQNE